MKVIEDKKVQTTTKEFDVMNYRCKCRNCQTTIEASATEFGWLGGLNVIWECPACDSKNVENITVMNLRNVVKPEKPKKLKKAEKGA